MAHSAPAAPSAPPPPPAGSPSRPSRPRKPQFSLRSMMIAMTAFAVVAALSTFVGFETIAVIVAGIGLMLMVPVALGATAYYSRGHRQTFFAGAFIGGLAPHLLTRKEAIAFGHFGQLLWLWMISLMAILACGFTALHVRRFVERHGWDRNSDDQ